MPGEGVGTAASALAQACLASAMTLSPGDVGSVGGLGMVIAWHLVQVRELMGRKEVVR